MACHGKQGCEKRREALLDAATLTTAAEQGAAIISKLLEIAAIGKGVGAFFKDPKVTELAAMIEALATENQQLKKQLAAGLTPVPVVHDADLTFKFGPNNAYELIVPAGDANSRRKLAQQLFDAAADLLDARASRKPLPGQTVFPFVAE